MEGGGGIALTSPSLSSGKRIFSVLLSIVKHAVSRIVLPPAEWQWNTRCSQSLGSYRQHWALGRGHFKRTSRLPVLHFARHQLS